MGLKENGGWERGQRGGEGRDKQLQCFDIAKTEKGRPIFGQQLRVNPGGEPKVTCPSLHP